RREAHDRTAISPIVSLQPRLVEQADTPLFRVRAERSTYWRLTGLDEFDGDIWRMDSRFARAESVLPAHLPEEGHVTTLEQEFTIQQLDDLWVPAAFEPNSILSSSEELHWNERS